jgi:hypothetical protein
MPAPDSSSTSNSTKAVTNGEVHDMISCNEVDSKFKELKVGMVIVLKVSCQKITEEEKCLFLIRMFIISPSSPLVRKPSYSCLKRPPACFHVFVLTVFHYHA